MSEKQTPVKVAVVTDNGETISRHFGKAPQYAIYALEGNKITSHELREKSHHGKGEHGGGRENRIGLGDIQVESGVAESQNHGHGHNHGVMLANISDCAVVITRGMGYGAYGALKKANLEVIITNIANIEEAVQAYADGDIKNHLNKLH
jgi:predicted Fe-Mo cluster-binding NifX family protein